MFEGALVALVTPFAQGKIDEPALRDLIEFQIVEGINGIVPCGTTGESATLSFAEHHRVVEITIDQVKKRVPVLAGTGANSTAEAIELTRHAEKVGADGALLITPYYNKPTPEGLYQHFKAIAEATKLPIVLYNVPGRTGVNMLPATVARLAVIENIIGIKEATGNLQQVSDVIGLCPPEFEVISGDDFTTFPIMAAGGTGVISVTANVAPREVAEMCSAVLRGDWTRARDLHYRLRALNYAMFLETNPIPVKTAVALMGKCRLEFRLPLCPLSEANLKSLTATLKDYRLIS